jgi:hypothetical protein
MAEADQPDRLGRNLEGIRHELAVLCRRSRRRVLGWPRDWRSGSVVNPRDADLQVVTEVGAWEFIAELLEAGHPIQEIDLESPTGKKGYVLVASGGEKRPEIYIKLQLGTGQVIGRSFHYSERSDNQRR